MYSKEEQQRIKQDFWTLFGKRFRRKWLLYRTGIKEVQLKFDFEDRRALVALDISASDPEWQAYYYEKLVSLKTIMLAGVSSKLIFDPNYVLPFGKTVSRIYLTMDGVKIQRKTDWPAVYQFFYTYMDRLESIFLEYKDYIES